MRATKSRPAGCAGRGRWWGSVHSGLGGELPVQSPGGDGGDAGQKAAALAGCTGNDPLELSATEGLGDYGGSGMYGGSGTPEGDTGTDGQDTIQRGRLVAWPSGYCNEQV